MHSMESHLLALIRIKYIVFNPHLVLVHSTYFEVVLPSAPDVPSYLLCKQERAPYQFISRRQYLLNVYGMPKD